MGSIKRVRFLYYNNDQFTMHRYDDVVVATGKVMWVGARYNGVDLSGDFRVTRVYVQGRKLIGETSA